MNVEKLTQEIWKHTQTVGAGEMTMAQQLSTSFNTTTKFIALFSVYV